MMHRVARQEFCLILFASHYLQINSLEVFEEIHPLTHFQVLHFAESVFFTKDITCCS